MNRDDLVALIAEVEAGTATGNAETTFVPTDTWNLIERVFGADDIVWDAFVGAHDGYIDDAIILLRSLLPDSTVWSIKARLAGARASAVVAGSSASAPTPARALLLATLRAKLTEMDAA